ncbi:MAG: flippase-like domain-containing protein [Candidatus Bathyarchaeota archaeon]|nr:flippase-like domain-containing protein [Candidatus Bathyarchaeota archaeon]
MKKHTLARTLAFSTVGLIVFILYIYFFIGIGDMIEVFMRVDPYRYSLFYSATIATMILSVLFYSMSWNALLKALSINTGLKKAFIYCWLGNFADLIVPFETVSGEIVRVYLARRDSLNSGKVIASVVAHRIITVFVTLSGLLFASIFFIFRRGVTVELLYLLLITIAGSLTLILLLLYVSLREEAAGKIVDTLIKLMAPIFRRIRFDPSEARKRAYRSLIQFHSGFKSFGEKWRVVAESIAYSFTAWFLHLSVYLLVFYAIGFTEISAKMIESIIVYAISVTVQSIPIALPLGLVEIVMANLYTVFAIPAAISGTATLLIRAVTFWLQIIVGYILAQWIGVKEIMDWKPKETSTCKKDFST